MGQASFRMMHGTIIYRARIYFDVVKETFNHRLSVGDQASKQADIWPIENVWRIVQAKIDSKLDTAEEWKFMKNKGLCKRMMASIPARPLQGSQITKVDY